MTILSNTITKVIQSNKIQSTALNLDVTVLLCGKKHYIVFTVTDFSCYFTLNVYFHNIFVLLYGYLFINDTVLPEFTSSALQYKNNISVPCFLH